MNPARIQGEGWALAPLGAAVEVTGKWSGWLLCGPRAARLLASTLAVEGVLAQRDCAAVHLFDCPAILARHGGSPDTFVLWVQASYADHLLACIAAAVLRD